MYPLQKIAGIAAVLLISLEGFAQQDGLASNQIPPRPVHSPPAAPEQVIKVRGRDQARVLLTWPAYTGEVSHYVVERSSDGRHYEEVGLLFSANLQEDEPDFVYVDRFRRPYSGPLYYRLRIVGQDASYIYTPVTVLPGRPDIGS